MSVASRLTQIAQKPGVEIKTLAVELSCPLLSKRGNCQSCDRYFMCTSPLKQKMWEGVRMVRIASKLGEIKHKIAIMSGKGGVGKSTVTVNLAAAFKLKGYEVGILDSDFYGPSIPKLTGVEDRLKITNEGIIPVANSNGIKVSSVGIVTEKYEAVTWAGDVLRYILETFLGDTTWGKLDFLLIDLPPGTGDETVNVLKYIKDLAGAVVVTMPSELSNMVVARCVMLNKLAKARTFGIVENMAGYYCSEAHVVHNIFKSGGGEKMSKELGVAFLGSIPLDDRICDASDSGVPFVLKYPDSPASKIYEDIADRILGQLQLISVA